MHRPDLAALERFYESPWGRWAREALRLRLEQMWPDLADLRLLAFGYPLPLLAGPPCDFVVAVPEALCARGGRPVPAGRVAVVREEELPFADAVFDRVLLVHALEHARRPNRLLREIWRVLTDGGRLLVVVPNRHGLWCWSERTPFGYGRPFTVGQLDRLLATHLFEPAARGHALWLPPLGRSLGPRLARLAEPIAARLAPAISGVLLREAEKRIYATTALPVAAEGRTEMTRIRRRSLAKAPAVAARDRTREVAEGELPVAARRR